MQPEQCESKIILLLAEKNTHSACQTGALVSQKAEQQIVPVPFRQVKPSAAITIHLSSVCVDIHDGASRETIAAVLSALKTTC